MTEKEKTIKVVGRAAELVLDSLENGLVAAAMFFVLLVGSVVGLLVGADLGQRGATTQQVIEQGLPIMLGVYVGGLCLYAFYRILNWLGHKFIEDPNKVSPTPIEPAPLDK